MGFGGGVPIVRAKDEVTFRPVLDCVLVEEIPVEESRIATPGGLELQRSERYLQKSLRGKVLAVGDGVPMGGVLMPMPYKPGMTIQTTEYGRRYIFLKPEDEFDKSVPRRYLIRVADTQGEVLSPQRGKLAGDPEVA